MVEAWANANHDPPAMKEISFSNRLFIFVCLALEAAFSLWEHQIQVTPVLGGRRAFTGPIRIVVHMIRDLSRPEAGHIAVVDIAFHRLTESGGPPCGVYFPARRKRKCAAHGNVRPGLRLLL